MNNKVCANPECDKAIDIEVSVYDREYQLWFCYYCIGAYPVLNQ